MTWRVGGFGGGETRDALIEGYNDVGTALILGTGWNIITSPVKNGTGAIRIPAGNTGFAILIDGLGDTNTPILQINCMQAWVNYDGNPAAHYLMAFHGHDAYGANSGYVLEVGTDRRTRICSMVGSTYTPLTGWSTDVLGNGAWTHLAWFLDPLTLGGTQAMPSGGTNHTWTTVLIDGVVQISADLGPWPYTLGISAYTFISGTPAGVDIRLDDICGLQTTDKNDAPHLAAAPIAKCAAQHPNAPGVRDGWSMVPNTGEVRWQDWDDATGNDGDATCLTTLGLFAEWLQDSDFQSSTDVGMGAGAVILESAAGWGPVWSAVHRVPSGTKFFCYSYCNLANDATVAKPGSTYEGGLLRLQRTSGSWAPADLGTLKAGATQLDTSDVYWRITSLMLQWVYYDTTLSLTPAPVLVIPFGQIF